MIYLISDTHFFHKNIIKFCGRPYNDVFQMNKNMIDKWNSIVKDDDLVIHLGDVIWFYNQESIDLISNLKGNKILIKGNHDFTKKRMLKLGFMRVYDLLFLKTKYGKLLFIHDPDDNGIQNFDYDYVLHGHIHEGVTDKEKFINICVEHINYEPIAINLLFKKE